MAAPLATIEKSPYAELQYSIDWTAWLPTGDTITAVTWDVDSGITSDSETNSTTTCNIKLSGGTVGETYDCVCKIETNAGLKEQRTLRFVVVDR